MFLVNFNENIYFGLAHEIPFSSDVTQIRAALLRTTPYGRTALYDAVAAGIEHLKIATRNRQALVVLSDGGDNSSRRTRDDVVECCALKRETAMSHRPTSRLRGECAFLIADALCPTPVSCARFPYIGLRRWCGCLR